MSQKNSLMLVLEDTDVIKTADKLYNEYSGKNNVEETVELQAKCLVALDECYFKRDSEIIKEIYADLMINSKEIPSINDIAWQISSINLSVCRCMAMTIYENDDSMLCETHHNAIVECKEAGVNPDDSNEFFAQVYLDNENEVISTLQSDIFNDYSFTLSSKVEELVEAVLDTENCIYAPSKISCSSSYYKLYKLDKLEEARPVVNDCQEILIPELSSYSPEDPELRFMRLESGISC